MAFIQKTLAGLDGNAAYAELKDKGALEYEDAGEKITLTEEDLLITMIQKEGYITEADNKTTVVIDTTLTPELIEEGNVNELISKIQTMRKEADFEVMDHIRVAVVGNDTLAGVVERNKDAIATKVLAEGFEFVDKGYAISKAWNINGEEVTIAIERV
jgi:isoleucyl-tRNA synthetase